MKRYVSETSRGRLSFGEMELKYGTFGMKSLAYCRGIKAELPIQARKRSWLAWRPLCRNDYLRNPALTVDAMSTAFINARRYGGGGIRVAIIYQLSSWWPCLAVLSLASIEYLPP
ncbi:hypothetical protein NPIL_271881 [Nephila pilipes]|uniref:Uncharacterized protein n=1 Tax=Nephila pilipes TaxID=299642 RepID=A0A8X6P5P9_NEPPI|nr:hypothetical protein NPIL_271881 [Nephila pilipes]